MQNFLYESAFRPKMSQKTVQLTTIPNMGFDLAPGILKNDIFSSFAQTISASISYLQHNSSNTKKISKNCFFLELNWDDFRNIMKKTS